MNKYALLPWEDLYFDVAMMSRCWVESCIDERHEVVITLWDRPLATETLSLLLED